MQLRVGGEPLALDSAAIARALPDARSRVVVMVHGLCMNDRQWNRRDHDHGQALARDLDASVLYLRYNSGRHISTNGAEFAALLEQLVRQWPVPAARAGADRTQHGWPRHPQRLCGCRERRRSYLDVAAACARLRRHAAPWGTAGARGPWRRSAARCQSLHHRIHRARQNSQRRHHGSKPWFRARRGLARARRLCARSRYARAAAVAAGHRLPRDRRQLEQGSAVRGHPHGDGLVPVASALGRHADPRKALDFKPDRTSIAYGTDHLDLLSSAQVYRQIRQWLAGTLTPPPAASTDRLCRDADKVPS